MWRVKDSKWTAGHQTKTRRCCRCHATPLSYRMRAPARDRPRAHDARRLSADTHTAAPHCAATRKPSPDHWKPPRTLSSLSVSPSLHFFVTNLYCSHFSISFLVQFCSGGSSIIRSFSQRSSFLFLLRSFKSPLAIFPSLNPYSRSHSFLKVFYLTTFSFPSLFSLQFASCISDSSLKP